MSKIMSDDQLRRRKKAQGVLSTGTGALGIAAGAAALGSRGKFGPRFAKVAEKQTLPLTAGSAAVGGIGSFNFAGIQRQESKKRPQTARNVQNVYIVRNRRQMRRIQQGKQSPYISKADDRKKTAGYGTLAAATGTAAVRHNAVANTINSQYGKYYDRKIAAVAGRHKGRDPRNNLPKDSIGRTVYESPDQRRTYRKLSSSLKRRDYQEIAALKRKKARLPVSPKGRAKILYGTSAVAIPVAWATARSTVDKAESRYRKRDVDAGIIGGALGAGLYQESSYALKGMDRRSEAKIAADPDLRAIQRAHQAKYKRPRNAVAGDKAWRPYFRNYPKSLPGGRLKRAIAVTHTGKSGVALTTGAGLATAGGAMELSRRHRNKNVSKSMMDFGLSGVRQGNAELVTKAYNPEHRRRQRGQRTVDAAPYAVGGLATGAGVYGGSAIRDFRRSGVAAKEAAQLDRTRQVALNNAQGAGKDLKGPKKGAAVARARRIAERLPTGMTEAKRAGDLRYAGKMKTLKAGGLGALAIGTGAAAHRFKEYQRGKGQTYRPLYR